MFGIVILFWLAWPWVWDQLWEQLKIHRPIQVVQLTWQLPFDCPLSREF